MQPISSGTSTTLIIVHTCLLNRKPKKSRSIETVNGFSINESVIKKDRDKDYKLTSMDRLRFRTRYFTDSGIIGTKGFVAHYYDMFKGCFNTSNEKKPKKISGLDGIYSLKRLANEM